MKISEWLDDQQANGKDTAHIELPRGMLHDDDPDEMVFFEEYKPCGYFCAENHPFSSVVRFGHWFYCKGQKKAAGIHSEKMTWHLFTKDRDTALKTARENME
ncbi:MAG TPA: hypothetical protein DHV36_00170 [Desulfobacteraceae bacterium]|nr:hypothetical protein [Desulfobacteraceae bacterium]